LWSGHINHLNFGGHQVTNHISGIAEAKVVKFCMHVGYVKSQYKDDKPPCKGSWSESTDQFFKLCPNHIFVIGKARHFKFRIRINTEEYECVHDILLPKGMCSESCKLFKFWKISDNILETVQDRDHTCYKRLIGNRMWPIKCDHCPMPLNDPQGHFCCLKPF